MPEGVEGEKPDGEVTPEGSKIGGAQENNTRVQLPSSESDAESETSPEANLVKLRVELNIPKRDWDYIKERLFFVQRHDAIGGSMSMLTGEKDETSILWQALQRGLIEQQPEFGRDVLRWQEIYQLRRDYKSIYSDKKNQDIGRAKVNALLQQDNSQSLLRRDVKIDDVIYFPRTPQEREDFLARRHEKGSDTILELSRDLERGNKRKLDLLEQEQRLVGQGTVEEANLAKVRHELRELDRRIREDENRQTTIQRQMNLSFDPTEIADSLEALVYEERALAKKYGQTVGHSGMDFSEGYLKEIARLRAVAISPLGLAVVYEDKSDFTPIGVE